MNKSDAVEWILRDRPRTPGRTGKAFAPANIALCKYWGKRDTELNLPVTSSLSISLGQLGASTSITPTDSTTDEIWLNGTRQTADLPFAKRLSAYLDLFRPTDTAFEVRTESTVPVAAGLASSASGFAALALALNESFGWELEPRELSILARLGSGSACRSIHQGFVQWHAGSRRDGMDSFAGRLDIEWPELQLGVLTVSHAEKPVSSREAMERTVKTSALYAVWPDKVSDDLVELHCALREKDFERLGRTAESNAMSMHATMMGAWPPVCYWQPETLATLNAVWTARAEGLPIYVTMDAGPNIKCLFLEADREVVMARFPNLEVVNRYEKGLA